MSKARWPEESGEINIPGIPGANNRWFPSQGQARNVALNAARQLGLGYRIAHDPRPRLGLPHYHLAYPDGRPLERTHPAYGHFFYGRRPPRRVYRGRPWREFEAELAQAAEAMIAPAPRRSRLQLWRSPRRPVIRGGGRGSGRSDPVLAGLMRVRTLIIAAEGDISLAAQLVGWAMRLLNQLLGQSAGLWARFARIGLNWLHGVQFHLNAGNRGAAISQLNNARLNIARAMIERRRQLGRP
ncbi:MAG: hypothetical protein U0401_02535 [Anaerolineae bacterium]